MSTSNFTNLCKFKNCLIELKKFIENSWPKGIFGKNKTIHQNGHSFKNGSLFLSFSTDILKLSLVRTFLELSKGMT